ACASRVESAMHTDPVWYAVATKPKQESRAEQNLRMSEFETYAPSVPARSPLKLGTTTGYRLAPPFPGYIFARFNAEQDLRRIRKISGVHDVVSFGSGAARVDDEVIAMLRARVAEVATRGAAPQLLPGEPVMIKDGP